jgi:hypothetical protein
MKLKRWLIAACFATLPFATFAQAAPAHPGFPRLEWKAGTSVTSSYQELTGTVVIGERIAPVLKVKDVEYVLTIRPQDPSALLLKNGATVAFKGVATKIVQAGQPDKNVFHPFEATIDGQTVKFAHAGWKHKRPSQMPPAPQQN